MVAPLARASKQLPRVVTAPAALILLLRPRNPSGLVVPLKCTKHTWPGPPWAAINALIVAVQAHVPGVTQSAAWALPTVFGKALAVGMPATVPVMVVFFVKAIIVNPFLSQPPLGWHGYYCKRKRLLQLFNFKKRT
jgi:hypothetical protein